MARAAVTALRLREPITLGDGDVGTASGVVVIRKRRVASGPHPDGVLAVLRSRDFPVRLQKS